MKFCSTLDVGRGAAVAFVNPQEWHDKSLDVAGWKGDLSDLSIALKRVSGVKVRPKLALPVALRRLFLNVPHHMFLYFEQQGISTEPEDFKRVIPDPLSAEDWFRFHNRYANGEPIVPE